MIMKLAQLPRFANWRLRYPRIAIHPTASIVAHRVGGLGKESGLTLGAQSQCHARILFDREPATIAIGDRSFVGRCTLVTASAISIGNDVLISWGVTIVDHDSHNLDFELRRKDVVEWGHGRKDWTHVPQAQVFIEDKAWVGFNAIILKGVVVGTGSVIAAGSVVTKSVPPWTVVGGSPAVEIRRLNPHDD